MQSPVAEDAGRFTLLSAARLLDGEHVTPLSDAAGLIDGGRVVALAAHCTSAQGVQNCLDAGVDMIIHCFFNDPDGAYRYRPDLVERLAAAKAWVNPTLYVLKAGIERLRDAREPEGSSRRSWSPSSMASAAPSTCASMRWGGWLGREFG